MPTRSSLPRLAALALLLTAAAACHDDATEPLTPHEPPTTQIAPALLEVTISGIGSHKMSASASSASAPDIRLSSPSSRSGVSYSLSAPQDGAGSGNGTIELEPLSTGSFTRGVRGSDGYRYVWATFRVRNAQADSVAYDTPRTNLTFFAAARAGTLGGSPVTLLNLFDGSPADPAIATELLPTGGVSQVNDQLVPNQADVLQILSESEAAAIAAPVGVDVLPYGFVVRNAMDGSRTLPASPAVGQFDGVVTFAFKLPLQATPAADPFSVTALFLAEDDSETRLTQSLEEQTPAGEAAFLARAAAIGATTATVLLGSSYEGGELSARVMCSVRTAGPSASPAAYLVKTPASVMISNPFSGFPLWANGSVARDLDVMALDESGTPIADRPVSWSVGTPGVLTAWGSEGAFRMLPRLDRASTEVSASICGVSSDPITVRTSGFSPIASGERHSLALRSDGTVVAWGDTTYGKANVPADLTGVVQVAAGGTHSLALKNDGTVVAWGTDFSKNIPMVAPAGLTGVVQVSAGWGHALALKSDGTVVAWGYNYYHQTEVPTDLTDVVQVSAGHYHSLALKSDGTVVAWGYQFSGQLDVPEGLTDVVQIAAGQTFSLALKSDGTVVGWGTDPETGGTETPPAGLKGVVQVATSYDHALALKSDGTVVGWGRNLSGEMDVPTDLTGVVQVAGGFDFSLALKSDGTVVAWGSNNVEHQMDIPTGLVVTVP